MSNKILQVTLDVTSGYLDVNEVGNPNRIPHGENDTITWELSGNAASGTFNAMDAASPGFEWTESTPNGVFGTPGLQASGKQIRVSDDNTDPGGVNSSGTWVYQLGATINGTSYTTNTTGVGGNTTDPTIQNL